MVALIRIATSNASSKCVAAQGFYALVNALASRWKPERATSSALSARSMALRATVAPARDALMVSPYKGNASRSTRRLPIPAVRVQP